MDLTNCSPSSSNRPRSWMAICLRTTLFSSVSVRGTQLTYSANIFLRKFPHYNSYSQYWSNLFHDNAFIIRYNPRSILDGVIDVRGRRLWVVFSILSLSLSLSLSPSPSPSTSPLLSSLKLLHHSNTRVLERHTSPNCFSSPWRISDGRTASADRNFYNNTLFHASRHFVHSCLSSIREMSEQSHNCLRGRRGQ